LSQDKSGFVAHASNPNQGTEAVAGKIVFDRWRLRFESSTVILEIPLTRLEIQMGNPKMGAFTSAIRTWRAGRFALSNQRF